MNPACDVAADELIAFTEEELLERRMRELEAHVPACPTCQERLGAARETTSLLRNTMPLPTSASRDDMLARIYQETEQTRERPHRSWFQVASLTAIGATFLLATIMFWSGIGQFADSIPIPFQRASQDGSQEWVADDDENEALFENAPLPRSIGADLPVYDWSVRAGIRVLYYQDGDDGAVAAKVSQFFAADAATPNHLTEAGEVDGVPFLVDDPDLIQEVRWIDDELVHHLQLQSLDDSDQRALTLQDVEQIVRAFLEQ